ncbi:RHS repeat-associated core domain-containing protein [Escherichia coli]|nr:RHS repeat-associated core domain-containing protein [Escherichia coli]WJS34416.1 RHS repeat-associated core domain-containing protein [Escherichia coli]
MSGKPAARQGDMTQYGGSIVQGSAGVRIGAPTGVACSVCPGGVTSGHPVNPLLGAKVLPGETDLALPGPLPFILSRTYSSYRTKTPAPVGSLGPGWKMPADIRLQLRDNTLILSDNGGRSLYFEHLFPGEDGYSRSESLWLVRGGVLRLDEGHRLAALWQALPEELRLSPHRYLATNSPQGPWWLLGWCERVPEADEVLPAPLPPYRVLTGLVDRFGRTQTFHREAAGEFSGEITGVTDGAGRHFRLVLTTQAQRAEEARQQAISGGTEPSAFPDTLPGYTEYGRDNGIRLSAVWLTHDPEYPENLPAAPLVRYGWTPRGELAVVYDRSNTQVRSFTYDDKYRGRMVAHRHTGRPEIRYRYDSDGRVTEQLNPAGLSYTYQYEKDHITITDSLDRREVLHTQGEAGLKRVVKKEHADGSVTQSQFDAVGRLRTQTDAAGRTTEYSPDVVTGLITRITTPDGRASAFYYNHHSQLTSATGPDGLEIRREYDEWGNQLNEENPHQLQQLIRLPGQQYDEESGLYYNRHRYYDPLRGRYITQDPIGLKGGWNLYTYPLSPVNSMDPLGLYEFKSKNIDDIGIFALAMCNGESINENKEYGGLICKKQGEYFPMNPISSNDNDSVDLRNIKCPEGSERVGDYHTHGFYSDDKGNKVTKENDVYDSLNFSSKDLTNSYMNGMGKKEYSSYLGTPNNTYLKYNPKAKGNGVTIIRQGSN